MSVLYPLLPLILISAIFVGIYYGLKNIASKSLKWIDSQEAKRNEGKTNNPYILKHLGKIKNDMNYEEYLKWLSNNNISSAPIKKAVTKEDATATKKIRDLFN